jgi:hypothetical protein
MESGKPHHHLDPHAFSRRTLLGGGAAFLAIGSAPAWSRSYNMPSRAELFVFTAPNTGNLIVAVTSFEDQTRPWLSGSGVRIHIGRKSWMVNTLKNDRTNDRTNTISRIQDGKLFVGGVLRPSENGLVEAYAAAIELSSGLGLENDSLDVWAEVIQENGSRYRVGNPFIAEIMSQNPALSKLYHKTSPDQDLALLARGVADHIAAISGGLANPWAHGRRLASVLLPDVIRYRQGSAAGFNFASQNGRHPSDATAMVVQTVLTGAVGTCVAPQLAELEGNFPYLSVRG